MGHVIFNNEGCAVQVTLLDSLRKRCIFVEKAIKEVGVQNTNVVWARAEEAGQSQQHREVTLEWFQSLHLAACSTLRKDLRYTSAIQQAWQLTVLQDWQTWFAAIEWLLLPEQDLQCFVLTAKFNWAHMWDPCTGVWHSSGSGCCQDAGASWAVSAICKAWWSLACCQRTGLWGNSPSSSRAKPLQVLQVWPAGQWFHHSVSCNHELCLNSIWNGKYLLDYSKDWSDACNGCYCNKFTSSTCISRAHCV